MSAFSGELQAGVLSVYEPERWKVKGPDGSSVVLQAVPGQYPIRVSFKDSKLEENSGRMKLVGIKMTGLTKEGGVDMAKAGRVMDMDYSFDIKDLAGIVEALPGTQVNWLNCVIPKAAAGGFTLVVNDEFGKFNKAEAHTIRRKGAMDLSM